MTATILYDNANQQAFLSYTFLNSGGTPTDPSGAIQCTVTDPAGGATVHTYNGTSPADITKVLTGKYSLAVSCAPSVTAIDGLWTFQWQAVGTNIVNNVSPGTFRVFPTTSQAQYCGLEELKDRLGITDSTDDYAAQQAVQAASSWVTEWCGQHFNRITETRTFVPHDIWQLDIDPLVSVSALNVDQQGNGVYAEAWVLNTDYALKLGTDLYNINAAGVQRPFRKVQVLQAGKWFPYIYPYAPLNRVQIIGTWGWPSVPPAVAQATLTIAAQWLKEKDAPFGIAGVNDFGVVRIQANPVVTEMLRPYINPVRRVGV